MNVWRLIVHHEDPDLAMAWTRNSGRIAIGWGKIGDLRQNNVHSAQDVGVLIRQNYPDLNNSGAGGSALWSFYTEMQMGDLVILSGSRPRELVVEVQGDYEFAPEAPILNDRVLSGGYQHQRRVQATTWNPEELWQKAGARPAAGHNIRRTLIRCALPLGESTTPGKAIADILSPQIEERASFVPVANDSGRVGRSGRNNKLTGQIGEFLVCAELGRRGFIATPFSGNVPAFDVIATDEFCRTVPIQVKASNHDNWPARAQDWMDIELDEETGIQHLRGAKEINNPQLIYVCVSIAKPNSGDRDRFFVLTKSDVQQVIIKGYSDWMEKHGWKRPRNTRSFDCRYFIPAIEQFEDRWELITKRVEESAPTSSLNTADE